MSTEYRSEDIFASNLSMIDEIDSPQIKRKHLDLRYANISNSQVLDLYLPDKGKEPYPTVIFVHGGAFCVGDKKDHQLYPFIKGLERGYAVASINYRMSGEAIFPASVMDVKAAIRFLRANAKEYCIDANKFALAGDSAGGNIAAVAALSADWTQFDDASLGNTEVSCNVQACVDLYGPTDFLLMDEHLRVSGLKQDIFDHDDANSPESLYLGAPIKTADPALVQKTNPITYVNKEMPTFLIQHGKKDNVVPYQQSLIFAQAIEACAGKCKVALDIFESATHIDPLFESEDNIKRIFDFLDKAMR